ncbi:MAG: hypothetical protein AUJ34_03645 [Parcubacteria group bacterium CG1_02_41_12]|nr:MAG: hypothetical protein AUJ34_03645 [Parcubacteria group bacterium CG1_02_41_12]PIZ81280.1 MAG: hypothetical protein COY02_02890 [Parcubacteria group bacterium CG_4_10_14_0_2_um_filter_41_6]
MTKQIQKVFDLINKTGDRCIILSENTPSAYAIMSLEEYERLALGRSEVSSLTEDQFLDKINRDIAVWKSQQEVAIENPELEDNHEHDSGNYLADYSENFDWDEEEEEAEEPYYFEKV